MYIAEIVPVLALVLLAYLLYRSIDDSACWLLKFVIAGTILSYALLVVHWTVESKLVSTSLMFQGFGKGWCIMRLENLEHESRDGSVGTLPLSPLAVTQWSLESVFLHWALVQRLHSCQAYLIYGTNHNKYSYVHNSKTAFDGVGFICSKICFGCGGSGPFRFPNSFIIPLLFWLNGEWQDGLLKHEHQSSLYRRKSSGCL